MTNHFDLGVIGGGIVGLATAYKYQLKNPSHKVVVFEKESSLGEHQTGRNSGVIHSGIYYKPGSFKAINCIDGRKQLVQFAKEHKVEHDICGKIILATNDSELEALTKIYKRGVENGIEGLEMLEPDQFKEIEPFTEGVKAIRVPCTGIINYVQVCEKLAELLSQINPESSVLFDAKVLNSFEEEDQSGVLTNRGKYFLKQRVFCTGLQSDRTAKKDGAEIDMQIVGFRGDYYELSEKGKNKVKHLIYPVPDPDFPFLGVHFTRMIDSSVECGPNAVFSFKREGYSRTSFSLKDTIQALGFSGTWKLFAKHYAQGIEEYKRAFSKALFLKALQKMIPSLTMEDIEPARSGVRAQALMKDGALVDDFKIEYGKNSVYVLNAPSPAATSCLSIADRIVEMIETQG
jgi:L-2-hydroxyglutarate oxidase